MIKVVPDTNVLISAVFWKGNPHRVIKLGFEGKYKLILSPSILEELTKKMIIKFSFPFEKLEEYISMLLYFCDFVEPQEKVNIITEDPSDNKIVECALASRSNYIVTGDLHLLKRNKIGCIKILTPKDFLIITRFL